MRFNEKLDLMECISGENHYMPVNLQLPQWWNECPKCGQVGLNYADGEARLQAFDENNQPIFESRDGKEFHVKFNEQVAKPITCKACGNVFTKR
jgi:transcription initiation factor IIE alpha subunit